MPYTQLCLSPQIANVTFYRPRTNTREIMDNDVFIIDPASGILQTNRTLGQFTDGYFNLVFRASNGPGDKKRGDFTTLKVPCSYISSLRRLPISRPLNYLFGQCEILQDDQKEDFSRMVVRLFGTEAYGITIA